VSQVVACTATANRTILNEVQRCLGMHEAVVVSMPIRRPNLSLFVTRKHPRASESDLIRSIHLSTAKRVLVFCRKRDETERVKQLLTQNGISASAYHGALEDRMESLWQFSSGATLSSDDC
jgi:ATP-dependent DNA helicase RecQ